MASIQGEIVDRITRAPLESALISLVSANAEPRTTVSGPDGRFTIELPPGRYVLEVSLLGYTGNMQEALAVSGRTLYLKIELSEQATQLEGVTITARPDQGEDGITLPIEKVLRMPANFFDPVRMLSSYPGVMTANDQANNIIVKGSSPSGLLWRLNGMDIVNPNHLANAGTINDKPTANGGGVNILSAQMLDRTSFYSGHLPTRYGNFTSGVLDMSLREGNAGKNEFTAQASLLGLDFSAEGPLNKAKTSSFLANYRYSTVGLLSLFGVNFGGEVITFQDLSFHFKTRAGRNGSLSFFGLGGLSSNDFAARDVLDWEVDKDRFDINYRSNMGGIGTRYDRHMGSLNLAAGATLSSNEQSRKSSSLVTPQFPLQESEYRSARNLLSSFVSITGGLGDNVSLDAGVMYNYTQDDLYNREQLSDYPSVVLVDAAKDFSLVQPYLQLKGTAGKFSLELGGRYSMASLASARSMDFRGNAQFDLTHTMSLALTGGQVSQLPQPGVYLVPGNDVLGFMHKRFAELAHIVSVEGWKVTSTGYYHEYRDVPVYPTTHFSVLSMMDGVAPSGLVADGSGTNKGVNVQVERSFLSSFYILGGGSLYSSAYKDSELSGYSTRFDGRYAVQVTAGNERQREEARSRKAFGVHARFMMLGGLREYPIDVASSRLAGRTLYDYSAPYAVQLKDYWRADLRLSWRKDKPGYTRTIAIDVQNVAATKNEAYRYFDAFQDQVVTQYQVGIIPVLVYRIDF